MRCPDCNKFVGLEAQDPEVGSLDVQDNGDGHASITGDVRCVLACADCGTELKETTFDLDADVTLEGDHFNHAAHAGLNQPDDSTDGHDLEVEEDSVEATETGGSRYKKNMRGFQLTVKITCSGCEGWEHTVDIEDSLQASAWDELV